MFDDKSKEYPLCYRDNQPCLSSPKQGLEIYKSVFDNMLDEVHIWQLIRDAKGEITNWHLVDANQVALDAWGKQLPDIVGKTTDEIFPGARASETFMPIVKKIFAENRPHEWESYFEGTNQHLVMKSIPLGDYFVSTGIDVTELKETQQELENSNLRLTESVKAGRVAIWDWNIAADEMTWDELMYEIYGTHKSKDIETVAIWQNALHPDDKEKAFLEIENALSGRQDYRLEFRIIRPDGKVKYIQGAGKVFRDESGTPYRMLGTNIDITEQREADDTLRETVVRLNESVKSGNIGIWEWDLKTDTVNFSKEYKEQLGYREDEFANEFYEWESRVHPEDLQATLDAMKSSIETCSTNHEALFRIKHKDGSYRWIFSHASVIPDEYGVAAKMIGTHVDITEKRKLEEELRQSQKMEAIGHLAGGIAHDFNNQLASIIGFTELVQEVIDDPTLSSYLQKILGAAEHSSNLTKQLLTFSRKQNIHLELVNIDEIIDEVVDILNRSVDKLVKIGVSRKTQKAHVKGDKSLIQNCFLNLCINARDAMPKGGALTIQVSIEFNNVISHSDNKNKVVRVDFCDTGEGIEENHLTKIFDPFFTTKEIGKGTGMGLASVYSGIKQMEGHISVESQLGKGSCFSVYLPMIETERVEVKHESNKPFKITTARKRILVIDDEPLIRDLCADFFKLLGHDVQFAVNGVEAVELYSQCWRELDLVLLDMIMPEMSGKDVFLALKSINPNIKVIIASGYTADSTTEEMLSLGVISTIDKPYNLSTLRDCIDSIE